MADRDNIINSIIDDYDKFREKSLTNRRFKHTDVLKILNQSREHFTVTEIGKSVESRSIFLASIGTGDVKILLWSQMHGDESTATMAIADIFNFFQNKDKQYEGIVDFFKSRLQLHFIPMLNPDGAEVFSRRNALGIDLNRDASRLESKEAKIFKKVIDQLKPDFAFNLHDQNARYSVGESTRSAAISFLAPPFDYVRSENITRQKSMKVIVHLYKLLNTIIPGHIAKFADEFEPRAFGDNIQKWGYSTILIESGGFAGDIEKQFVRKLNFIQLISAFNHIASGEFLQEKTEDYHTIPFNTRNIYDLILRNVRLRANNNKEYFVDIGINRYEVNCGNNFYYKSRIEEMGDMGIYKGYEEFDAAGMIAEVGGIEKSELAIDKINRATALKFLKRGVTTLIVDDPIEEEKPTNLPINFVNKGPKTSRIAIDSNADLVLFKEGEVQFAIVNGFTIDLYNDKDCQMNGLAVF